MNTSQQARLAQKQKQLHQAIQAGALYASGFWAPLQTDEALLISFMNSSTAPAPGTPGNMEFGWALYYLNHEAPTWLTEALQDLDMPPSNITTTEWAGWWTIFQGQGKVFGDGSWLSTATFAVMDIGWALAITDYLLLHIGILDMAPLASNPATLVVDPGTHPTLTVAIIGDWGTGSYTDGNLPDSPSQLVMQAIAQLETPPDILIHLGDVYYAGTGEEETANLLNGWIAAPLGNFTLNSNHEMYDGANGYFKVALADRRFAGQQQTSYFSITYGDWVLVGLDSAYNATGMYMDGAITDTGQQQFIANQTAGKQAIILTHHNPVDVLGSTLQSLWSDVVDQMAAAPIAWYWGHIHNGIVYNSSAATGATLARCLGNAGIPIGNAAWLDGLDTVEYYTHTPLGDTDPNNALRVKNGFAVLTIANGSLTEAFYDQDGNVAWRTGA